MKNKMALKIAAECSSKPPYTKEQLMRKVEQPEQVKRANARYLYEQSKAKIAESFYTKVD